MWPKLTVAGCLLLTAFVMHTALRIEYWNDLSGMFLPRANPLVNTDWEVAELHEVLAYVDSQIAKRRSHLYSYEHPEAELPATETFVGAPYNSAEQGWIDRSKVEHDAYTQLRWWVRHFGTLQYVLAPLAFLWAAGNFLGVRKLPYRLTSTLCGLLAFSAIFLMIFRGY